MTITLTPRSDMAPVPRVEMRVDAVNLPTGTTRVTFWRVASGRSYKVRGGINRSLVSSISLIDFEAPFRGPVRYEAECWNGVIPLGRVLVGTTTLSFTGTVLQHPLEPRNAVEVLLNSGTAEVTSRPSPGAALNTEGSSAPTFVGFGPRRALVDFPLVFRTATVAQADLVQSLLGDYDTPRLPVLLMRTSLQARMPAMMFMYVPELLERDMNSQFGGTHISFSARVDEVAPPAPALVVSTLSYTDLDFTYSSYTTMDSAFASYDARDRAFNLAGAAG